MAPKKKKNPVRCCVFGCKNTSENSQPLKFYRFPNANFHTFKKERRENWISFVRQTKPDGSSWQPHEASRICSQHFVGNIKTEHPLNPNYNPSIIPDTYKKCLLPVEFAMADSEKFEEVMQRKKVEINEASCSSTSGEFDPRKYQQLYLQHLAFNEIQNGGSAIRKSADKEVQVNFVDDDVMDGMCKIFICNRYIHIDHLNCHISDAEVQACIPDPGNCGKFIVKKFNIATGSCKIFGTCHDKAVETHDREGKSLLQSSKMGFDAISLLKNDRQMLDFAGVTLHSFRLLLKIIPPSGVIEISREKRLLIFLLKMKCGLGFSALSVLFAIDRRTASKIFVSTLKFLVGAMKNFVFWPSKDIVRATMPQAFKKMYRDCRVIIDRMELRLAPPDVKSRVHLNSHCYERFLKVFIGFTPSGSISFISKCHGGQATDAQMTHRDSFIELLEPGDIVLANKKFPQIETMLDESGRKIMILGPPFINGNQISGEKIPEPYRIARFKIHIKRILQRLRSYQILDKFTLKMVPNCDDIVFMCCVLVNLQQPIMKKSDVEL